MKPIKIVVFDLDETLGYFTELGLFWDSLIEYIKAEKINYKLAQDDFNETLDLFDEFVRPNIVSVLNYLKYKTSGLSQTKLNLLDQNKHFFGLLVLEEYLLLQQDLFHQMKNCLMRSHPLNYYLHYWSYLKNYHYLNYLHIDYLDLHCHHLQKLEKYFLFHLCLLLKELRQLQLLQ